MLAAAALIAPLVAPLVAAGTFTNPIRLGADPWLTHSRGMYHLAVTNGRNVTLQSA